MVEQEFQCAACNAKHVGRIRTGETIMAKMGWVDAPREEVRAFEAEILFARMKLEGRRLRDDKAPWTEDEWRAALKKVVDYNAEWKAAVAAEKAKTEVVK